MAPRALLRTRKERKSRSGTRRATDKSLNLKRTPHAFAYFIASMEKNKGSRQKRRLRGKQFVSRIDLVALRWKNLPDAEKLVYVR